MSDLDSFPPLDDDFIDRIVDGTLTPAELRAAAVRLDRDPGGWKRCAVAFLEAQCWRESFRACDPPAKTEDSLLPFPLPLPASPTKRTPHRWLRGAVAAGIVAASFAMGWLGHAARPGTAAPRIAALPPGTIRTHDAGNLQPGSRNEPGVAHSKTDPRASWPTPGARPAGRPAPLVTTVARLQFGPANARSEVPILAGPGIDEKWVRQQPPPVSEHGQVVLQQHGYQVDQRRRVITRFMADGRRVAVPVDQVLIRYTGNQPL
jgi:hypothetical protein